MLRAMFHRVLSFLAKQSHNLPEPASELNSLVTVRFPGRLTGVELLHSNFSSFFFPRKRRDLHLAAILPRHSSVCVVR